MNGNTQRYKIRGFTKVVHSLYLHKNLHVFWPCFEFGVLMAASTKNDHDAADADCSPFPDKLE